MYELAKQEQASGRLPLDIEVLQVELPEGLREELEVAQSVASKELRGGT